MDFAWIDDFSAARNFAFSHATQDYILWLDADDVILPEDQEKLKILKSNLDQNVDAVTMHYVIATDEYGNPLFHYKRNRLVKRSKSFKWIGPVHEYLDVNGNIIESDVSVLHKKSDKKVDTPAVGRNLRIYDNRIKKGEDFSPRDLFYYANELRDHNKYQKAIIYYKEFLEGKKGWVEDNIRACLYMADCYALSGQSSEEMEALLKTLIYDEPRPEACCRLGDKFKAKKDFQTAVFWYTTAYQMKDKKTGGFQIELYSTWYPHLSLCVCHWELGNVEKSIEHNELAKQYRSDDPQILFNEKFFNDFLMNRK